MRILFFGTPGFAVPALERLLEGPDTVAGVVSQPDRPSGRGLRTEPTPVARRAREAGVPLLQPEKLRAAGTLEELRALRPDLIVTCAFGRILRPSLLELPVHGCLNIHASLLPRHRGAAPVVRSILDGDLWSGITIFRLDEGMDTGPMLLQRMERILPDDTTGSLTDRLALLGGTAIREACDRIREGSATFVPQEEHGATYAPRLRKEEGELSWSRPADQIERFLRAMDPWPGCRTRHAGRPLRVAAVEPLDRIPLEEPPGTILSA
ncbi:MAG: methionyl-tRNA formyltransferase, partial [Candidatus Eisenbacteria bacterium]|nr:methionyl-tRNA formyltransferase [Candidatus Latescibacterota bacterium]MBD3300894.1 methionyl-tRNA formyltransferase [Candidatus Eisenbacteria bacterium]